jgi:hypothetical protein
MSRPELSLRETVTPVRLPRGRKGNGLHMLRASS